ncbi:hypothetical protein EAF00_005164 [Botryotinia globosa]|nr:hypothetical protein EAF00_005164 [Botryotinia globosa]
MQARRFSLGLTPAESGQSDLANKKSSIIVSLQSDTFTVALERIFAAANCDRSDESRRVRGMGLVSKGQVQKKEGE